ncbi:MAG: oligosaccharide flippase family protein [Betaproteobacteria bacterium]|nr:oligosaccharide flippase family protein [Betaproteobacteria bacterium]
MTLRTNTVANFVGQGYVTAIAVIMLPLYLRDLGAEAYGLVGFFVVMQAWLRLLDMGLSPALGRELAHARGLAHSADADPQAAGIVRAIERLFLLLAIASGIAIWRCSGLVATRWLHVQSLPIAEVTQCVTLMGLAASLRWLAALYRSGIQGLERQVWLNSANMGIATLRYVGVWAVLHWISHDPRYFFGYELGVSLGETALLHYGMYRLLPTPAKTNRFSWAPLSKVLPFAGGVAYAALVWVLLTQIDKLILSNVLPLRDYGYYALVAVIANSITSLGGPISSAVLPRMTGLLAQERREAMTMLYRKSSQMVAVVALPISALIALVPQELIYAWTGDRQAAQWGAPILAWLALGNGLLALSAFQYYLQYAHGKIRLHVWNSTINALIQTPLIIFAAYHYGAYGAALTWFILRVVSFIVWPPIIHHVFAPGLHKEWLVHDIAPILAATSVGALLVRGLEPLLASDGRLEIMIVLACAALSMLLLNSLVSWSCRPYLIRTIERIGAVHG